MSKVLSIRRISSRLLPKTAAIVLLGIAILILHRQLSAVRWADIGDAVLGLSAEQISLSILFTFSSFACLAAYEIYAVCIIGCSDTIYSRAAFAGVVSNAIGNTLGFHALTAGAVRYRIYSAAGLSLGQIAQIITLAGSSIGLSFICVAIIALIFGSQFGPSGHGAGLLILCVLAGFLFWLRAAPRTIVVGRWTLPFPGAAGASAIMVIGVCDMLVSSGALYVLLPRDGVPGFFDFLLFYISSVLLGIIGAVPGGAGIMEASLLASFPGAERSGLVAALLLYRLIYNLLPFCGAGAAFLLFEHRRKKIRP